MVSALKQRSHLVPRLPANKTLSGPPAYNVSDAVNSKWSSESAHLGARVNGGPSGGTPSYPFDGSLREFIVLNRQTTAGEASRLGRALMAKSGLTKLLSGYA